MDGSPPQDLHARARLRSAVELAAALAGGSSATVIGEAGTTAVLRAAGTFLAARRTRVVLVRPPLDLPSFMGQLAQASAVQGATTLETAYNALTALDPGCDQVALLVEDAHALTRPTLRYIDFTVRASPGLRVALAGRAALLSLLAMHELPGLRGRLTVNVTLTEPAPPAMVARSAAAPRLRRPEPPGSMVRRLRWAWLIPAGAAAGLALAALWPGTDDPSPFAVTGPPAIDLAGSRADPDAVTGLIRPADPVVPEPADLSVPADPDPEPLSPEDLAGDVAGPDEPLPVPEAPPPDPAPALAGSDEPTTTSDPAPEPSRNAAVAIEPSPPAAHAPVQEPPRPTARVAAAPARPVVSPPPATPPVLAASPRLARQERAGSDRPAPNAQRCRAIVLRVQLGEDPTDADRTFLQDGCR